MAFATRAELWAAVSSLLNRADLDDYMPVAQALAESVLRRELRVKTVGPVALSLDDENVALPADCQEVRSLALVGTSAIGGGPLLVVPPAVVALHRARTENIASVPSFYAVVENRLMLAPAPASPVAAELYYFQGLPALATPSASNWLLDAAPDAYFYGMLVQFAEFLKEDDRIPRWGTAFAGVIEQLNQQRARQEYGAAPLRMYNEYVF